MDGTNEDPRLLTAADFYMGHDDDPLRPPPDFVRWRAATAREQASYQRPMHGSVGPRTRVLVDGEPREVLNFGSLDYLGLNRHPDVIAAMRAAPEEWGTGACGVPMLTGTLSLHHGIESLAAALAHQSGAMLFSSGFAGGVGLMSALLRRGDVAVADEYAHMCWMDGIRLSGARLATFAHNDPEDLDRVLGEHAGKRRLVVVDGLYSMDGDYARLPELLDVTEAHGAGLVVDEAHSIFAVGEGGGGVSELLGVSERISLLFGTFSKALSQLGGFAAADPELLEYAKVFAHPYGFSAALPPTLSVGIAAAMRVSADTPVLRERLADNARYFREGLRGLGFDTGRSESHVIPLILGDQRLRLYESARRLLDRGLYVVPVDYPAVPEDAVRFRFAVTAAHARADLDEALGIVEDVLT